MALLRRAGIAAAALSFARSERGRQLIADLRTRVDTPENRAKAKEAVQGLRARRQPR